MSAMSDSLETDLINHLFRTATFAKPTVLAFALLTTAADDANTGVFTSGTGVEVTNANAYARQDEPPLDANWAATSGSDGLTSNLGAITYPQATGSWGTVAACAICDNITHDTGAMFLHGTVTTSKAIDNGDTAEFAIGAVTVTMA